MRRKRIAVLTAQADEYIQERFLSGFFERAFELDYDVCVFSMYLKYQDTYQREIGDANIFNLVELDRYDAIVMFTDRIRTPGIAEGLLWRIKQEFSGPVLVMEDYVDGYDSINIDHRRNMCELTDHLIDVHGCRDIVMLNGWQDNANSIQKMEGFFDSLKKHGLECADDRVYYGNNWYDSGRDTAVSMLESRADLPDAVVRASDYMAIGFAAELEKRGINVPAGIAVVGYDTLDANDERVIPLTSMDIPAKEDGIYAVSWIDSRIKEQPFEQERPLAKIHPGRSCGCERCVGGGGKTGSSWDVSAQSGRYGSYYDHMMEDLLSQREYREFYNTIF